MRTLLLIICLTLATAVSAQNPDPLQIECSHLWQKNINGNAIGVKGMFIGDYNGNGRDELIVGNENLFNIVEFVPEYNSYEIIWGSKVYSELQKVIVADADNDGTADILVYYNDEEIELYDLATSELKGTYDTEVDYLYSWACMIVADADNDGFNELIITNDDITWIYRISNGICSQVMEIDDNGDDARCDDIDGDGLNELVFSSGNVYRISNNQAELIWNFDTLDEGAFLEIADIDNDNLKEILSSDFMLKVFDGDTRLLKWQKYATEPVKLTVANTDSVGFPEIIYMEKDWGDVVCIDAVTYAQRWKIDKREYGAANVVVGDTDGDGNLEVVYGSDGFSFAERDHLHIIQIFGLTEEYVSINDKGRFNIKLTDIDNDNRTELITLSQGSELYKAGIISVYDAETKELEWRSNENLIPIDNSDQMQAMETADVDGDGDVEIVIACVNDDNPALIYINGRTHELDTVRTWNFDDFQESPHNMAIGDLNNDGILEIVTVTQDTLWIINSRTLERTKSITWWMSDYFDSPVIGNIDNDPNAELVYVKNNIFIMDGVTEEIQELDPFPWDVFIQCFLFDYNHDGISDIIALTDEGIVFWINGITLEAVQITFTSTWMYDLHFANVLGDSEPEMVYTAGNKLYIRNADGSSLCTTMSHSPIKTEITDYNNDGEVEIFFAHNYSVQEWNAGCYNCGGMTVDTETHNTSCFTSDGSAAVFPYGGTEPYKYLWNTGDTTSSISGLPSGTCNVSVTDAKGCSITLEMVIESNEFSINQIVTTSDYITTTDCEGQMQFITNAGTPPYSVFMEGEWISLTDSTLTGLCQGTYQLTVKDGNGCISTLNFIIEGTLGYSEIDASLQFQIIPNPASGSTLLETGRIITDGTTASISTLQGIILKVVEITSQRTLFDISKLPKGIYMLTLTNSKGRNTQKLVVE